MDKCRMDLSKRYNEAAVEHNIILNILEQKKAVESGLEIINTKKLSWTLLLKSFLQLSPASNLEDFIYARKFTVKSFQK